MMTILGVIWVMLGWYVWYRFIIIEGELSEYRNWQDRWQDALALLPLYVLLCAPVAVYCLIKKDIRR